jgi:hypothetical protein
MLDERAKIDSKAIAAEVDAKCLVIHGDADETISWVC